VFYEERPSEALRFGDVIRGFVVSSARVDSPQPSSPPEEYGIEVEVPEYSVILTPCCSIRGGCLSLSPLLHVLPTFFDNPYLAEDLTRVNRPIRPQQSLPPAVWERMDAEEKAQRFDMARPLGYAFNSIFVYPPHDLLPSYQLNKRGGPIETQCFMVDFARACRVLSEGVHNPQQSPLQTKILELTVQARAELREKMADYFGRVPAEDLT
jgi:hypothetical protein